MQRISRGDFKSIGDVIKKLSQRQKWSSKLSEAKLLETWEEIVGATIARHTLSLWLQRGKLYLKVDSSVLRQELSFSKEQLILRLNESLEEVVVKEIVLL